MKKEKPIPLKNQDTIADIKIQEWNKQLEIVNAELKKLPSGTLSFATCQKKKIWLYREMKNNKISRNRIALGSDIYYQLCRKTYLLTVKQILERDIQSFLNIRDQIVNPVPNEVFLNLPSKFQDIEKSDFFITNIGNQWANEKYNQSDYLKEQKTHYTSRGLKVRSKSEVLIAEQLYEHNIPFRYEEILPIKNKNFIPDFTIKKPNDEIFYWEHCGMTSDEKYMIGHNEKMNAYYAVGIKPWKNLIVTYDDEEGNIDLRIIQNEIKLKLL